MARKLLGGGYRKLALLFSLFSAILFCTSFLACRNASGGADPNDGPATVSKIAGPGGGKPVFITAVYSTTVNGNYDTNDPGNPKFYEAGRSVESVWKDEVPDDLKPYTIMELHANAWAQTGNTNKEHSKTWYDTQLAICEKLGIKNVAIVILAAYGYTSPAYSFNYISPKDSADKTWLENMLAKYSCLKGFVSTEHYWCANYNSLGDRAAEWVNFCDEKSTADRNLMFYVFDGQSRHIEMVTNNNNYKTAMEDKGKDHLVFGYKYTNPAKHTQTFSYSLGEWLNGHSAAFGGLPDTWSWKERGWWTLFGGGNGGWDNKQAVQYPEGAMAIILANMYMNGGTVWNFEAPWVTYGNSGKKSEMQASILEPLLKYTIEHPAPTREEMISMTKHVYKQNNTSISYPSGVLVDGERGRAATDMELLKTGRYGHIPAIISNFTESSDLAGKTSTTAIDQNTWEASYPKQTLDLASGKTEGFAAKRNFAGSGNLDMWFMYNYNINPDDSNADNTKKQYVKIPLNADTSKTLEVEMTPHTLVIAKVGSGSSAGKVDIWMTNYRLDKDSAISADWAQQVQKRDAWITENLCETPKYERWVRDTVFTVEGSNDVAYKIIDGQHLSGRPAYTPKVTADSGVVTVNGNGWLRFVITY